MTPADMAMAARSIIFNLRMVLPRFGPKPSAVTSCDMPVMRISDFI
jgi:hypothetical protein